MHAACVIKLPYFYSNVREKWGGQKIREINMFDHFFFFFCSRRVAVASFHDFFEYHICL